MYLIRIIHFVSYTGIYWTLQDYNEADNSYGINLELFIVYLTKYSLKRKRNANYSNIYYNKINMSCETEVGTSSIPRLDRRDIGKRAHTAAFELLLPYLLLYIYNYCYHRRPRPQPNMCYT